MLLAVAVWLMWPYFQAWPKLLRNLVMGILAIIAISPYVMAEIYWPRIFDTFAEGNRVNYQFASVEYAVAFWDVNSDDVIETDLPRVATNMLMQRHGERLQARISDQVDANPSDERESE